MWYGKSARSYDASHRDGEQEINRSLESAKLSSISSYNMFTREMPPVHQCTSPKDIPLTTLASVKRPDSTRRCHC